ncbi:NLP/P60 protein [Paenibacillus algicola]|uniref:NLP/P60 protein n=1 Tax=Paenibacillus algicola TaxID=2565926 RepID=A0A4P8XK26_9BACL|nr:C40 family peptidase [Paenibacillus algicola]QCT01751.1 NLP/P60 protein [Paenibacillus algicola]
MNSIKRWSVAAAGVLLLAGCGNTATDSAQEVRQDREGGGPQAYSYEGNNSSRMGDLGIDSNPQPGSDSQHARAGSEFEYGQVPVMRHAGKEYVDVQQLTELLGYRMRTKGGTVLIGDTGPEYELKSREAQALRQGETVSLSEAPETIEGKLCLPVGVVEELFGQDMALQFAEGQLRAKVIGEEKTSESAESTESTEENTLEMKQTARHDAYRFQEDEAGGLRMNRSGDDDATGGNLQAQAVSGGADKLLTTAKKYLGVEYVFGSTYPEDRAFDCSSYTQHVFKKHGVSLPRTARSQSKVGKTVSRKSLRKGDLLFFRVPGRFKSQNIAGHVGIYMGDGMMIHALDEPKDGVQYRSINLPFWEENFLWAKRVSE